MGDDKWKDIDQHVNSMTWAMSGNTSGSAGRQPGHTHRRSEPNVGMIRKALPPPQLTNEPRTAPVQVREYTLDWSNPPSSVAYGNHMIHPSSGAQDEGPHQANYSSQNQNHAYERRNKPVPPSYNGAKTMVKSNPGGDPSSSFIARANSPVTSVRMYPQQSTSIHPMISGNHVQARQHGMFPSYQPYSPKSSRRSSAPSNPVDPRAHSASPNITRRSQSAIANRVPPTPMISSPIVTPVSLHPIKVPDLPPSMPYPSAMIPTASEKSSNDDEEYTKVLLQHQRDRMERLGKELNTKKDLLYLLTDNVKELDERKSLRQRNDTMPSNMPTLRDINRLRKENLQMEINCNCMIKEIDSLSKSGPSINHNFHDSIGKRGPNTKIPLPIHPDLPSPPLPPPPDPPVPEPDTNKWHCSYCTFLNHAALNKCEICEYRREPLPLPSRTYSPLNKTKNDGFH